MIEVRAWDKINKKMIKVDAINYWNNSIENEDSQQIPFNEIILLRKSNYKDKNGKNIYEGDKLKHINKYNEEVIIKCIYKKREIVLSNGEIAKIEGFYFINSDFDISKYVGRVLNETIIIGIENLEVIGHVYEN